MKTITITYDPAQCQKDCEEGVPFDLYGWLQNELNAGGIDAYIKEGAITVPDGDNYALDDREHATVLAALRCYKGTYSRVELEVIATNSGTVKPLDANELDALCERLNCGG